MAQTHTTTWIRQHSAEASTTSAPTQTTAPVGTAATGIVAPGRKPRNRVHVAIVKGAASGTRTARVVVYAYRSKMNTETLSGGVPVLSSVATTGWDEVWDSGTFSDSADFNKRFVLDDLGGAEGFYARIVTNGGSTPTLTLLFGFDDQDVI